MTPDWVAMGSTVFFIMVSLPAVTEPVVQWRDAEIPMACCICSAFKPRSPFFSFRVASTTL